MSRDSDDLLTLVIVFAYGVFDGLLLGHWWPW